MDVIEFYGSSISDDPTLIAYEKDIGTKNNISGVTNKENAHRVHNKMLTIGALHRADKNMYSHILHDMHNQFQLGTACYPSNLTKAFDLLQNYHGPPSRNANKTSSSISLQFAQQHDKVSPKVVPGNNGKVYEHIIFSHCKQLRYYKDFCPDLHHKQHAMMEGINLDPDSDSDFA
jgi:hypothetical protein